ncbi:uncharacterized protein BJ171DRAFT_577067 [Polychytrium aggregatum]|uniref:uncharacterized protein n=1 Tax=Polychytrium aggregatum TaxID=110093 RepID=UPI0022FE372C|nr:uncharacterized protein BJ171DRAFT_577067 [Polychytrium aggregatum]KAI9209454.1 hypothetical protein BJ171DRAFT_577067 [Polychytrium aggregatum]
MLPSSLSTLPTRSVPSSVSYPRLRHGSHLDLAALSPLQTLPNEVLTYILLYVNDCSDWVAASATCKSLYVCTRPLIYRAPHFLSTFSWAQFHILLATHPAKQYGKFVQVIDLSLNSKPSIDSVLIPVLPTSLVVNSNNLSLLLYRSYFGAFRSRNFRLSSVFQAPSLFLSNSPNVASGSAMSAHATPIIPHIMPNMSLPSSSTDPGFFADTSPILGLHPYPPTYASHSHTAFDAFDWSVPVVDAAEPPEVPLSAGIDGGVPFVELEDSIITVHTFGSAVSDVALKERDRLLSTVGSRQCSPVVKGIEVSASSLVQLAENCPNLKVLHLGDCIVSSDVYIVETGEYLSGIAYRVQPYLTQIEISPADGLLAVADNCPHLISIDLRGAPWVTEKLVRYLVQRLKQLRCLNLERCMTLRKSCGRLYLFKKHDDLEAAIEKAFPN